MPTAPPRACVHCGKANCTTHQRGPWHHRRPVQRMRGRKLQRARQDLFVRTLLQQTAAGIGTHRALCVLCLDEPATIRDHIIPLAEGGTDTPDNEQAIGEQCHRIKTQLEAQRGQQRAKAE